MHKNRNVLWLRMFGYRIAQDNLDTEHVYWTSISGNTFNHQICGREIWGYNDRIAPKNDRHLDSTAVVVPVEFRSTWKGLNPNLLALGLCEILRKYTVHLVNGGLVVN